jgi:hypothetical protein
MRKPEFITFTGIDDRTDLARADKLASKYPIEWGVLISDHARDARFPSDQTISEMADIAGKKCAHLCGDYASILSICGTFPDPFKLGQFDRVQVNGRRSLTKSLMELASKSDYDFIFQTREKAFTTGAQYLELFDCSGGQGRFPDRVPELPGNDALVGYSGGIGPATVTDYLKMIQGEGRFWIDMEWRVRSKGWFDLDLVEQVCQQVYD